MVNEALKGLTRKLDSLYEDSGRYSIPLERLLRLLLLQVRYSIRGERLFCEQLDNNLLFRSFVRLSADEKLRDHSTFTRNRARLLEGNIARAFFK